MSVALPCAVCDSDDILPVSDCENPPTYAIACDACGEIDGFAESVHEAVTSWNNVPRKCPPPGPPVMVLPNPFEHPPTREDKPDPAALAEALIREKPHSRGKRRR